MVTTGGDELYRDGGLSGTDEGVGVEWGVVWGVTEWGVTEWGDAWRDGEDCVVEVSAESKRGIEEQSRIWWELMILTIMC